ncbi:MAG: VOC family protein [Pseudomonadota bacterium]
MTTKICRAGLSALILLASCDAPQEQKRPTDFRRTTLIVADMERSLTLYRDALGFVPNYDTVLPMSGVALPAGEPGAKARLVLLEANDRWVGWIGLLQWVDPPLDKRADTPTRMGIGDVVLLFNTEDIDARCASIKGLEGVRMTSGPSTTTYPGRDNGPGIDVRGCNFFDADGHFVELNQVLD